MDGPYKPSEGHSFNVNRRLLDPFATAISQVPPWDFDLACGYGPLAPTPDLSFSQDDNAGLTPKCIFMHDAQPDLRQR